MQPGDITRVQTYLRKTFGTDRIHIDPPKTRTGPVEVRVDDEFIGTLHRDVEDGEVSFSLHIMILEEDLPPAPAASGPAPRRR